MASSYIGPLTRYWRLSDGTTQDIYPLGSTGIVNTQALHAFCDNTDCFVQIMYDQGSQGNNVSNLDTTLLSMPRLFWERNGLPEMAFDLGGNVYSNKGGNYTNRHMWLYTPGAGNVGSNLGLPTTGPRTLYVAADNYNPTDGVEFFGYGGSTQEPGGEGSNDGFTAVIAQPVDANNSSTMVFGNDYETQWHWGAYLGGYGKVVGLIKYDLSKNWSSGAVLPAVGCGTPTDATTCPSYTVYGQTVTGTVNTGANYGNTIRFGTGTDDGGTGGRFQSGMIAGYATSLSEDSDVMRAMAGVTFRKPVTGCSANPTSTITAAAPTTTGAATPPTSYPVIPALNEANLVAAYSTVLWNPNYQGPLLQVKRQDNGNTYDIYAAGCEMDVQAATNDCSGTTCYVWRLYDQSGHGWTKFAPSTLTAPTLALTGVNGKPAILFTNTAQTSFTGQMGASATTVGNGDGTMTATSVTGYISVGDQVQVPSVAYTDIAVVTGQSSGTTGGAGTYTVVRAGTSPHNPQVTPPTWSSQTTQIISQNLIVTAWTSGVITVGQGAANLYAGSTIQSQVSGTAGQTGTYKVSQYQYFTSRAMSSSTMNMLLVDPSLNYQAMASATGYTLCQNMTIEATFLASTGNAGIISTMSPAWDFGWKPTRTLTYGYSGGYTSVLAYGSAFNSTQAHFAYLTADQSAPQNLAINQDNGTATTGTTTAYTGLCLATTANMMMGGQPGVPTPMQGYLTQFAIYNDVESAPNLLAHYNRAHAEWATP